MQADGYNEAAAATERSSGSQLFPDRTATEHAFPDRTATDDATKHAIAQFPRSAVKSLEAQGRGTATEHASPDQQQIALPHSTLMEPMPEIQAAFFAIPEMQRLHSMMRNRDIPIPYFIVGGAVRDIVLKPNEMPKDIDCQVCLPSKDDIHGVVAEYYEASEIKVQP